MGAEHQSRSASSTHQHHHAEPLTEEDLQDLELETIQNEIADEAETDEAEAEANQEEIADEATESLDPFGATGHQEMPRRFRGFFARFVLRQMIKAVLAYTIAVTKRMYRHASLRRKLQAASRRGPRALRALVGPAVLRAMPKPFRRMSRRLVAPVTRLSFRLIARTAGLNALEIDSAELESEST